MKIATSWRKRPTLFNSSKVDRLFWLIKYSIAVPDATWLNILTSASWLNIQPNAKLCFPPQALDLPIRHWSYDFDGCSISMLIYSHWWRSLFPRIDDISRPSSLRNYNMMCRCIHRPRYIPMSYKSAIRTTTLSFKILLRFSIKLCLVAADVQIISTINIERSFDE